MKRGTTTHPKLGMLAEKLRVARYAAVGILETLWHWAGQYAKAGDIGKYPNTAIAQAIGWEGDADALVAALVESRWVDHDCRHRLIVHDWPDHCEDAVHMALARAVLRFANGSIPKMTRLPKDEKASLIKSYGVCTQKTHTVHTPCGSCAHCLSLSLGLNNNPGEKPKAGVEPAPPGPHAPPPVEYPTHLNTDQPCANGDELDGRIRAYLGSLVSVVYSPVAHANVRKMVELAGWEEMADAMASAAANHADEPTSYARKVLSRKRDGAKLKASQVKPFPKPLTKAVTHNV